MFDGTYTSDEDDDSNLTTEKFQETIDRMAKILDQKLTKEVADIFGGAARPSIGMNTAKYSGLYPERSFMLRPIVKPTVNYHHQRWWLLDCKSQLLSITGSRLHDISQRRLR